MDLTYPVNITPTVFEECVAGIEDAVRNEQRGTPDPTDPLYLKLHAADLANKWTRKGLRVDLNADELRELVDRFDYYLMCWRDNITGSSEAWDYARLIRSGTAIIKQAKAGLAALKS